jgi:hypothetical protein
MQVFFFVITTSLKIIFIQTFTLKIDVFKTNFDLYFLRMPHIFNIFFSTVKLIRKNTFKKHLFLYLSYYLSICCVKLFLYLIRIVNKIGTL